MNKIITLAVAAAAVSFGFSAENADKDKPLKVLMIGNSFSISCLCHLPQVAEAS
jgi:hypothetical protein